MKEEVSRAEQRAAVLKPRYSDQVVESDTSGAEQSPDPAVPEASRAGQPRVTRKRSDVPDGYLDF